VAGYIVRRLLLTIPVLLGAVTIVFFVMRVIPGDVARNIAGQNATTQEVEEIRHQLGLDDSIFSQYLRYMSGVARGDLGRSVYSHFSVRQELMWKFPNTVVLAVASLALAAVVGITMGVIAAARQRTIVDYACMTFAAGSLAFPNFVVALMLVYVFAEQLGWLPATGARDPKHMILPVTALALREAAVLFRMSRATMLDVLHGDFVRTARAKGLTETRVLRVHALRNALLPVVTVLGLQLGFALGGTVIIESIFAYPGVGNLIVSSINQRDYTIVQGGVLLLATGFVFVNLIVDLLYGYIDPRVRHG
jgi:ABC-type dipeptide/oligopeptide/nickel transport system permease component